MTNWSVGTSEKMNGYTHMRNKLKTHGGQCAKCESTLNITVDHIIPQNFLTMLGFPDAYKELDNLQYLCEKHNIEKGNILDYTNPRTLPLLKMYVNRWIEKHAKLHIEMTTRKLVARCQCCPVVEEEKPKTKHKTKTPNSIYPDDF